MNKVKQILAPALAALMLFSAAPLSVHAVSDSSVMTEAVIAEDVPQDTEGRIADIGGGNFIATFIDGDPEHSESSTPPVSIIPFTGPATDGVNRMDCGDPMPLSETKSLTVPRP